jgi:hypothetical protein
VCARACNRALTHMHTHAYMEHPQEGTHMMYVSVSSRVGSYSVSLSLSLPLSLWERNGKRSQIPCVRGCVCVCVMVLYACQVDVSRAMLVTVIAVFGKGVELRD